jgi:hypothetical protein
MRPHRCYDLHMTAFPRLRIEDVVLCALQLFLLLIFFYYNYYYFAQEYKQR